MKNNKPRLIILFIIFVRIDVVSSKKPFLGVKRMKRWAANPPLLLFFVHRKNSKRGIFFIT